MDESNQNIPVNSGQPTPGPENNPVAPETPTVPPQDNQPTVQPVVTQPQQPVKKRKTLPLLIILLIVVLIAGGGVSYWVYHKHKTNNQNTKHDIALIRYAFFNNPLNAFYPSDASDAGVLAIQPQLFEGLVSFQNGTQIKPQLASSWTNPNDNTWVFKLKPNIHYHDGDVVTAQDVVYTWQQINKGQTYSAFLTNTISNVKAIDSSTVQITTKQPDPILLNRMAQMYIIDSKAASGTQAWELGTGAYTVKPGTTPSANSLDIVAFNGWHGGHAYTREVDYTFSNDPSAAVKGLNQGKYDLVDQINLNDADTSLRQNYNVFTTPQLGINDILFDTLNPSYPTANIKVRQALALALNGQTIMTKGQQTGIPASQTIAPTVPGYNPAIKISQPNIEKAKSLLASAGYPNGVTINLGTSPGLDAMNAEIIAEAKQVGITINDQVVNDEQTFFQKVDSGSFQSWLAVNFTSLVDGSDQLSFWQDSPYYSNKTFDNQLAQANATFDATQRLKYLQQASLTVYNDYAYVPLYQVSDLNVSVKGIVYPLDQYDSDLNVYFANVYRQ